MDDFCISVIGICCGGRHGFRVLNWSFYTTGWIKILYHLPYFILTYFDIFQSVIAEK